MAKLNTTDFLADGLALDDAVAAARTLEAEGLDGIEVSGGMAESGKGSVWTGLRAEADEGYFVENAAAVKRAVRIPVSGLGGIRTLAAAERYVAEGGWTSSRCAGLSSETRISSEGSGRARSTGPTASPATSASIRAASAAPRNEPPAFRPGHSFRPGLRPEPLPWPSSS